MVSSGAALQLCVCLIESDSEEKFTCIAPTTVPMVLTVGFVDGFPPKALPFHDPQLITNTGSE